MENTKAQNNFESIIKENVKDGSNPFNISKTYPAYIVLVIMLSLSFFIYNNVKNQVNQDFDERFEKSTNSIMSRFENQYQNKFAIVKSMSGLYQLVDQVVRDYFDLYGTVPAKTYPSILSIEYVEKVKDADLSVYTYFISTQGYSDYSFKAQNKKDIYYSIHHILPYPFNGHRLGLDMSNQPQFFGPAMKAANEDKIVATESYVSRSNDTLSFYLIAPIYNKDSDHSTVQSRLNNLKGFLSLELNTKVYFDEALSGKTNESEESIFPSDSLVYFKIIDRDSKNKEYDIYESKNYNTIPKDYSPLRKRTFDYKIADRNLRIEFATIPDFGGSIGESLPIAILIISLLLSFAFFGFVLSVTTSRARALAIADKMTESQRRIVESSQDIIGVINTSGLWLNANNATNNVLNVRPELLLKSSIFDLIIEDYGLKEYVDKTKISNSNLDNRITVKVKYKDTFKWVNWNLSYVKVDQLIYITGRDITLEKIAEEEAQLKTKQIKLAEMYALEASESKTYFMKKLSHQLRNSLTGILGYLQLISNKLYDTEEELNQYVDMAEQSSEEIFNFVSDIVDATLQTGGDNNLNLSLVDVGNALQSCFTSFKSSNLAGNSSLEISNESLKSKAIADSKVLSLIYFDVFSALSSNLKEMQFTVEIQENPYEGATEIQVLTSPNIGIIDLIKIYKTNAVDIINFLQYDKYDFLFKLSNIASLVRRLNGSFTIDSLGEKDGNLITILLPRNKQLE
ncbi:MAG TPA: CHASE domain-containing protein [Candidatus Kapabacteria bacterium]|nr:CHASE domain-containing protein [Candidatus Kapabacteria bacterium]